LEFGIESKIVFGIQIPNRYGKTWCILPREIEFAIEISRRYGKYGASFLA
jgi:hypothetical protein